MKECFILLGLIGVAFAATVYESKYEDVEVDKILANGRVLTNYVRCLLDEGPCTAEGRELKKILPDALASECSQCNEKQRGTAERVIEHLRVKRPRDWDLLTAKYDPEGHYKKRYDELHASKKV